MHVHIVARDLDADTILPRLVADLVSYPESPIDWTAGINPDGAADVNYFFPYLEIADAHRSWKETQIAAWFSHRDEGRENKVKLWDDAAAAVDIRTTSARIYLDGLANKGPSFLVTPPLDMGKFRPPARKKRNARPVVGTSGFVYPGGRKGEDLIARLMGSRVGNKIDVIASGRGWPCPTTMYPWGKQQQFYWGLDVYVCTSSIEGIGYGPLEALASGVPIVIPRGVGVFDELPNAQNLFRYEAGNFESLEQAVQMAIDEPVNVESLRSIATRFTSQAWHDSHVRAFGNLRLEIPAVPEDLPDWRSSAGVVYIAYGGPARECAQRAMVSMRDHMPGLPICLISDKPIGLESVFVEHPDSDVGARSVKTKLYDLTPPEWQYVLYLDADTEVVADISLLFQVLADGWEWVICINPAQYVLAKSMLRPDNEDEIQETFKLIGTDEILQYNGGVFGFRRNERTALLMAEWHREWDRYGKRDQAALDRALYNHPVRVYTLGNEWNTITRYIPAERTAGILHYPMSARRWKGRIEGRLDQTEAWAAVHPERHNPEPESPAKQPARKPRKGLSDADK